MRARNLSLSISLLALATACGGSVVESGPDSNDGGSGSAGSGGSGGASGAGGSGGAVGGSGGSVGGSGGVAGSGGSVGGSGGSVVDAAVDAAGSGGGVSDGGTGTCDPGFCQDAIMSSCGDPDYIPIGGMACTGASGDVGFCCLPACGGLGGATCPSGQYCEYPPALGPACGAFDGIGVCQWAPDGCDDDCPGVCGCDGQFYCNECNAHQAGFDVSDSMSCVVDGGTQFPAQLEGIWMIGWAGGLNHYSWVRFGMTGPMDGTADFLAGDDLPANAPYWPCSGQGTWMVTAKPDTVQLMFPSGCSITTDALTFLSFGPTSGYPEDAILYASIETPGNPGAWLEGYKFPASQCAADMSSCENPFGY